MGSIAAIGEAHRVQGLGLVGVAVLSGDDPEQVRARWAELPDDVVLVILTPRAADALPSPPGAPLTVVMPP
jgi:vacuolar-type H+-ATPase subunit F/Vma7